MCSKKNLGANQSSYTRTRVTGTSCGVHGYPDRNPTRVGTYPGTRTRRIQVNTNSSSWASPVIDDYRLPGSTESYPGTLQLRENHAPS
eukprot:2822445-Rhodomonas_salina.1